jgi:hypothetical protein
MVSSSVDADDIEKANEISDIAGYFIKPIKASELNDIIAEIEKAGKS